jgi:hypothetical protein
VKKVFYILKPLIPRTIQIYLRRVLVKWKVKKYENIWPINESASNLPNGWSGWPNRKKFAFVLTHDVETALGQEKCHQLLKYEQELGFCSSYNFVPERYEVSAELRSHIVENGFEVGVHGLNHDGKLYKTKKIFMHRAKRINKYLSEWNAVGFRSPAMHNNLDWIHELNIEYDASTFDTDPFEPQPTGVNKIFPFWVSGRTSNKGYVELPYTLVQDFTLFILMNAKDVSIWKKKAEWIVENGGMVLLNVHPDYIYFGKGNKSIEEYPVELYVNFLEYIKNEYNEQYWHVLPKEIAEFWRKRMAKKTNDTVSVGLVE